MREMEGVKLERMKSALCEDEKEQYWGMKRNNSGPSDEKCQDEVVHATKFFFFTFWPQFLPEAKFCVAKKDGAYRCGQKSPSNELCLSTNRKGQHDKEGTQKLKAMKWIYMLFKLGVDFRVVLFKRDSTKNLSIKSHILDSNGVW